MFLYFLDKNQALFVEGRKKIEDSTLVALTIMIAESRPEEKEMILSDIGITVVTEALASVFF